MRIISGKYKGKKIEGYDICGTRPTMDRVKESVFGMIHSKLKGSVCLDLFAGSGSLGLEALSNGANTCYFIDNNPKIITILQKNIKNLNIEESVFCIKQEYRQALLNFFNQNIQFDFIFLDPPYPLYLLGDTLKKIENLNLLKPDGMIVCEYETEVFTCNYPCIREKRYGTKGIKIYQNSKL